MAKKKKKTTKKAKSTKKKKTTYKAKGRGKTTGKKKSKSKRKPNAAFMKPLQPSTELAAIVGGRPIPRTQVVKALWAYIRRNKLQDTRDRRSINADSKLQKVFGGRSKVNMFEMTKLVSKHLS